LPASLPETSPPEASCSQARSSPNRPERGMSRVIQRSTYVAAAVKSM